VGRVEQRGGGEAGNGAGGRGLIFRFLRRLSISYLLKPGRGSHVCDNMSLPSSTDKGRVDPGTRCGVGHFMCDQPKRKCLRRWVNTES